jgi:hypothetical protein
MPPVYLVLPPRPDPELQSLQKVLTVFQIIAAGIGIVLAARALSES